MGNFFESLIIACVEFVYSHKQINQIDFTYSIADPTQLLKPKDRTKDMISIKNKINPQKLDQSKYLGCDTIWKTFKRAAWLYPNEPFLGTRKQITPNIN